MGILILVSGLYAQGYMTQETYDSLLVMFSALGVSSLRAALPKKP